MFYHDSLAPDEARPWKIRAPKAGQLPTAVQLLSVFQGSRFRDHEVYRSASTFVLLHRSRIRAGTALVAEIDQRRHELIDEINEWSSGLDRPPHLADIHTGTLGTVVDRLAHAWVDAHHGAETAAAGTKASHRRWLRLAELIGGYNDLVHRSMDGARRHPTLAS